MGLDPTNTYFEVRDLLSKLASDMHKKVHWQGFDDNLSDMHLLYMKCCAKYNPSLGIKFSSYLYRSAKNLAASKLRESRGRNHKHKTLKEDPPSPKTGFSLLLLAEDLTKDAFTLAKTALDLPEEVASQLVGKGCFPGRMRKHLRCYLHKCGWTHPRIAKAFAEVQEAFA